MQHLSGKDQRLQMNRILSFRSAMIYSQKYLKDDLLQSTLIYRSGLKLVINKISNKITLPTEVFET